MEDYDKFVQHLLSHLRKSEEQHNRPPPASSLVRFYGQPILPPLLSGEKREEMQRHRDGALKAAVHRKLKDDSRMANAQTILNSVQLRKTPTLEEFLQESEINTKSSHNNGVGSVSSSDLFIGTKDVLLLSSPPRRTIKDGVSLPPLTSTTCSAFLSSNVTPHQSYQERCLVDQLTNQPGSQLININSVSGRIDAERDGHCPSEGTYNNNNKGGFFLHNTSNTIAKMPDIINYPPIDGEELERSGLESSSCSNFIVVQDISSALLQEDPVICDHLPVEKSESSHLDSTEVREHLPIHDLGNDHNLDKIESPVSASGNSGISDNLELSQTLSTHHSPTTDLHIQQDPTESEPVDDHVDETELSEEPYRLSLQALLKKSQEYRRRQRMLRNQAKNTKIQKRTQEQTRAEEQSLSNKENDEFPYMHTVTAEGKKPKERRGTLIPSLEMSLNESWQNERMIENEFFRGKSNLKSESTHLTGDRNTKEITTVEEKTVFKNVKLNISKEAIKEPKQISTFLQQQLMSTETSPLQEAFYLTTRPAAFYNGAGKYHSIPAPNFCRSPVRSKSKGSIQDGDTLNRAETSQGEVLVDTGLIEDQDEEVNLVHKNSPKALPSTANLMVENDVTSFSAKSSKHIDQLESNLSSLKVLISDLESTLTDNNQTESNTQSEFRLQGVVDSRQSDGVVWEEKLRDGDDCNDAEQDKRYGEWPRRKSLKHLKKTEDAGPELSMGDTEAVPLIVEVKKTEAVSVNELELVKILATERGKENKTCKEGLTKSFGQHSGCRKPSAKCILSATQRLRIPDAFRDVPSAATVSHNVSVLSDTSNHPAESRNGTAVEAHDSIQSASLNQSYDVGAPSDLWLFEGSGSDMGLKCHLVREKNLTPESGGEGQGAVSNVKRRLLMHVTEETRERSADAGRGADSVVRPNTSTPVVHRYEDHISQEDKQEQLKQAHAAQVRALQDQHRRQQEELLQAMAVHYRHLQSVSFPCSISSSRLGDTLTFSTLSQASSPLSEQHRPLLLAAVKGFLARRLLKTERVGQLVRTIRDTHQFLQALQQQSPGRGEFCSRQDLLLQERVTLQLRAARYEVHDIFFSLSAGERMRLISWDRELAKERELKQQSEHTCLPRRKSSLSTATQKSLERKRGMMIQKKAAERYTGVVTRSGRNTGFPAEQPPETKRGQFRANPQRIPKSTYSSKPR